MKTILIVEDSEEDLYILNHLIKKEALQVNILTASDGEQALEMLESMEKFPDLILLDINMPRINGLEFLKIHTQDNKIDVPVVVMLTSSDQAKDKEQAFFYNCVKDYLIKPLTEENVKKFYEYLSLPTP